MIKGILIHTEGMKSLIIGALLEDYSIYYFKPKDISITLKQ